jgi:hypothetical protein
MKHDLFNSNWEINVSGYSYTVINNVKTLAELSRLGDCDSNLQEIRLNVGNLPFENKLDTLIHEILEAIRATYRVGYTEHEDLCRAATGLTAFLINNPYFLTCLSASVNQFNKNK